MYSYKRGAKLVTWDHQVVWDYKTPDKTELQSATLLQNGGVLLGICGIPAQFIELDKKGKEVNKVTLNLEVERPHSQFRQVFQLRNSNYLIPVMAKQKVLEVSRKGRSSLNIRLKARHSHLLNFLTEICCCLVETTIITS